jgi:hypothetical protein
VEKDYAEFSLLSGHAMETVVRILETARKKGIRTVGGFVPFDYHLIRVCETLGFRVDPWAKHGLIFEKRIQQGASK